MEAGGRVGGAGVVHAERWLRDVEETVGERGGNERWMRGVEDGERVGNCMYEEGEAGEQQLRNHDSNLLLDRVSVVCSGRAAAEDARQRRAQSHFGWKAQRDWRSRMHGFARSKRFNGCPGGHRGG